MTSVAKVAAMSTLEAEETMMLPKSAAEQTPRESSWIPKLNALSAMLIGFVLGVLVTRYIDRPSNVGPPPPDEPPSPWCPSETTLPLAHREVMDVPLDYFNAGYSGAVGASDPRNFGPDAWRTLHRFSVAYPDDPTPATQKHCRNFLEALPYMIPCPHCGYHFLQFVVFNEKWEGRNMTKCRGLCSTTKESCATRMNLVDFFARAHNNVNANNYPCRPSWTAAHVIEAYNSSTFTTQGPIDGKCELLKSESEQIGLEPNWIRSGDSYSVFRDRDLCEPGIPRAIADE